MKVLNLHKINKLSLEIYLFIMYVLAIIIYFSTEYYDHKKIILSEVDARLKQASIRVNESIPSYLYDNANNDLSISDYLDKNISMELTRLAKEMNVKYVYSFIEKDGKIYYISSSLSEEETEKVYTSVYMTEYQYASEKLKKLFKGSSKELVEEDVDGYGFFRSYLLSYRSPNGLVYVTGADIEVEEVNLLFLKTLSRTIVVALFVLLAVVPVLIIYKKITKLEVLNSQSQEKLKKIEIDEITGLPFIEKLWADNEIIEYPTVFLIAINNLKLLSSHYGDKIGNGILQSISRTLLETKDLGLDYKVYKVGLDEYAVILENKMTNEQMLLIGEYLLESFYNSPHFDDEERIFLNLVIGVASYEEVDKTESDKSLNLKRIFLEARMALNYALEKQIRLFVYDMHELVSYNDEVFWAKNLVNSIENKKVQAFYQPIYNVNTKKIEKYESLMRVISKEGKIISPYHFLDVAHRSGLYFRLTSIMIYTVFEYFSNKDLEFSINISTKDIRDKNILNIIMNKLKKFPEPRRIVFELLETENIMNYEKIKEFINDVKIYGCKIAIDDFGSGYSNFERIGELDIDYIKIDGSLIKTIDISQNNEILVQMIIDFSKKIGVKTIAEYVHSENVYNKVKEMGIDYVQGYFIGEPQASI